MVRVQPPQPFPFTLRRQAARIRRPSLITVRSSLCPEKNLNLTFSSALWTDTPFGWNPCAALAALVAEWKLSTRKNRESISYFRAKAIQSSAYRHNIAFCTVQSLRRSTRQEGHRLNFAGFALKTETNAARFRRVPREPALAARFPCQSPQPLPGSAVVRKCKTAS